MSGTLRAMSVALPYLRASDRGVERSMERLSTGLRIVRASDDAAGLAIAERLRASARGALVAHRTATDALSLTAVADSALGEIQGMLQRTRELAVRYVSGTMSAADRAELQAEAWQIGDEIAAMTQRTSFNGRTLLTGGTFGAVVGSSDGDLLTVGLPDVATAVHQDVFWLDGSVTPTSSTSTSTSTVVNGGGRVKSTTTTTTTTTTGGSVGPSIARLDDAIDAISTSRSELGAFGSRLGHVLSILATSAEQYASAESRIRDADMAVEMTRYVSEQLRRDAGLAVMAQARTTNERVFALTM